jgi:hypothetical protein
MITIIIRVVNVEDSSKFSARASLEGFIYQFRYALLESLKRKPDLFTIAIDTLDDIVVDKRGNLDHIQTKNHGENAAKLSNKSPDLWKTLRIWCEFISAGKCDDSTFYLVTTSEVSDKSVASFLKFNNRDEGNAIKLLNEIAESSLKKKKINNTNIKGYKAFNSLSAAQKKKLVSKIVVLEKSPSLFDEIDKQLREVMIQSVKYSLLDQFLNRLEEWWLKRVLEHIRDNDLISSTEINSKVDSLRDEFTKNNLPIDLGIEELKVNEEDCKNYTFVHQLNIIKIDRERILDAMEDFYKAYKQRSKWVDDGFIYPEEIEKYDKKLHKRWKRRFLQKKDDLNDEYTKKEILKLSQKLYEIIENDDSPVIRPDVTEEFIIMGSYHNLANELKIGWHLDYENILKNKYEGLIK